MTQKNPTLLQQLKELAADADDDEEIVSELIPQDESDKIYKSKNCIITNSTVIPVLICHTGYTSPTIVHSLVNFPRKKDRYNKKNLGAIEKRGSENEVVWITLQARQFKWKKLNILKVKGYGTESMYIFYSNPNHQERFF